jgi:hypothetical protein
LPLLSQIKTILQKYAETELQTHAIPVADIEEGLYNESYFGEPAQRVDSVHQTYLSKN